MRASSLVKILCALPIKPRLGLVKYTSRWGFCASIKRTIRSFLNSMLDNVFQGRHYVQLVAKVVQFLIKYSPPWTNKLHELFVGILNPFSTVFNPTNSCDQLHSNNRPTDICALFIKIVKCVSEKKNENNNVKTEEYREVLDFSLDRNKNSSPS